MDEATSSVDPENEDELQRAIEALTHDKTIIMIAHRLKTVRIMHFSFPTVPLLWLLILCAPV